MIGRLVRDTDPPKTEQFNSAGEACNALVDKWDSTAVFLPELANDMEEIERLVRSALFEYRMSETTEMPVRMREEHYKSSKRDVGLLKSAREAFFGRITSALHK